MFNIICDSREKIPLDFSKCASINDVVYKKLDTGDYCIQGLEDTLCIERKRIVSEFANNIIEKRFKNWVSRMAKFKYKYLVFEFSIDDIIKYPIGSTVPPRIWKKIRVRGPFILKTISKLRVNYGIDVIYCGNEKNAQLEIINIMERIYDKELSH